MNRLLENVLSKLDSTDAEAPVASDEELEAQAKADRIAYHRRSVRNGPVTHRYISTGQQRRQAERDRATLDRKINRRHRRSFLAKQRDTAALRGNLQLLGALEHEPFTDAPGHKQRLVAATWIIDRYAPRTDDGDLIVTDDTLAEAVKAAQADLVARSRR